MSKRNLKYAALGAALLAVFLVILGLVLFRRGTTEESMAFAEDRLLIISRGGQQHLFDIELAETPAQLAQGLMYRDHLDADRGMLFIFPTEEIVTMWMHNTQIPLDMIFIDSKGKVADIAANNRPYDDRQVSSHVPVRAALEINGGQAAGLGIAVGDTVQNDRLNKATSF